MFIQGFGKAIREGPQAFPKCRVQAEWCLSALHRHSENWVHCAAVCAGDPLVPTAKSRGEWERGPRISSLNAQGIGLGIWQPARLPAGMSPQGAFTMPGVRCSKAAPQWCFGCPLQHSQQPGEAFSLCWMPLSHISTALSSLHHEVKSMSWFFPCKTKPVPEVSVVTQSTLTCDPICGDRAPGRQAETWGAMAV